MQIRRIGLCIDLKIDPMVDAEIDWRVGCQVNSIVHQVIYWMTDWKFDWIRNVALVHGIWYVISEHSKFQWREQRYRTITLAIVIWCVASKHMKFRGREQHFSSGPVKLQLDSDFSELFIKQLKYRPFYKKQCSRCSARAEVGKRLIKQMKFECFSAGPGQ